MSHASVVILPTKVYSVYSLAAAVNATAAASLSPSSLLHILHSALIRPSHIALLVRVRDPTGRLSNLHLCAVSAAPSSLHLVSGTPPTVHLHCSFALLPRSQVVLLGDGVLSVQAPTGPSLFFQLSSVLTLFSTVETLRALIAEADDFALTLSPCLVLEQATTSLDYLYDPGLYAVEEVSSPASSFFKPDVALIKATIAGFIASAGDSVSSHDVVCHLRGRFGSWIVQEKASRKKKPPSSSSYKGGYPYDQIDRLVVMVLGEQDPPSLIVPGVWLGSEFNAAHRRTLAECGVSHILNVAVEIDRIFPDDFAYMKIHIVDTEEHHILPFLERAVGFIDLALKSSGVLVHCQQGVSRSASVVVAYLMARRDMSLAEALALVKAKRSRVKPNKVFMEDLKAWEASLRA